MKIQAQNFINKEENLKVKVALNYLKKLGFTEENLEFETRFSIQLGKRKHKIHGFSDILCSKGDKNLFIIEVKAENIKITQSIIDQGISYARLVHPVAPFVIVTNGKEKGTFVIDTISKEKINESEIVAKLMKSRHCNYKATISLSDVYEALKNFIGYCPENIKEFSESQVIDRMSHLKGDESHLNKKYIPSLFVERQDLLNGFNEFMESPFNCFALIGESGVGKTNYICDLTERFKGEYITLFFDSKFLKEGIISSIKDDFNWVFSPTLEPIEIFRNLETLAIRAKTKVCFFIDAIDEAPLADFNLIIDDFVRKMKNFSPIKVCLSCKLSEWNDFLEIKGDPTCLSESLFPSNGHAITRFGSIGSPIDNIDRDKVIPGFLIQRFNEVEMETLNEKYQKCFGYKGHLTASVKNDCKLGFMLRVVAEVYKAKELPEQIDDVELFDKYLQEKFRKIGDYEICSNYLKAIGSAFIDSEAKGRNIKSGFIEEDDLRERLNIGINEKLLPELFTYDILLRIPTDRGIKLIGFYYPKIRDYIICFLSLRLHRKSVEEFKDAFSKLLNGPVGQSALSWYATISATHHKDILRNHQETHALMFLNEYVNIIEKHFPSLKKYFEPHTASKVGIVVADWTNREGRMNSLRAYGFRSIKGEQENLVEVIRVRTEKNIGQFFRRAGVISGIKARKYDFISQIPKEVAIVDIEEQLKDLVRLGKLDESNNLALAQEKVIRILCTHGEKFNLFGNESLADLPPTEEFFPIIYDDIITHVKEFYARKHYERKLTKGFTIEIVKNYKGTPLIEHRPTNEEEIRYEVAMALQENRVVIPEICVVDNIPIFVLLETIRLLQKSHREIAVPLLPPPDFHEKEAQQRIEKIKNGDLLLSVEDIRHYRK